MYLLCIWYHRYTTAAKDYCNLEIYGSLADMYEPVILECRLLTQEYYKDSLRGVDLIRCC